MVQPADHTELTRTLETNGTELINQGKMYDGEFSHSDLTEDLGFVLALYGGTSDEYVRGIVTTGVTTAD